MPFTFPLDKADFQAPNGITYSYDGLKWKTKSFRAPDSDVKVGDVPPEDPTPNVTLWFDTTDLELLLYYDDGSSCQWVPCSIPLTNSPEYKALEKKVSSLALTEQAQVEAVSRLNKATVDQQRRLNEVESKTNDVLSQEEFESSQSVQDDRLDDLEVEQKSQGDQINDNALEIEALKTEKGTACVYKVKSITGLPDVASRAGEMVVDAAAVDKVTYISLAPADLGGTTTRAVHPGDLIEFVERSADAEISTATTGDAVRYKITSASDASAMSVEYVNGANDFELDELETVYIYPQQDGTVSEKYVDEQDALRVLKSGDEMTGDLVMNKAGLVAKTNKNIAYKITDAHYFKGTFQSATSSGEVVFKVQSGNVDTFKLARYKMGLCVKAKDQTITGMNSFAAYPEYTTYDGRIKQDNDIVNKKWVLDQIGASGGGGGGGSVDISGKVDKAGDTMSGKLDFPFLSDAIRTQGAIKVKQSGESISGKNIFSVDGLRATYTGPVDLEESLATKKYVDDHPYGGGAGAVEVWDSKYPPSGRVRGSLVMTTTNALYIYTEDY